MMDAWDDDTALLALLDTPLLKKKKVKKPGKITDVHHAQIYLPNGLSEDAELQLEVYREKCNGISTVVTVSNADLIEFLNAREQ